jgi:hypothetical protein
MSVANALAACLGDRRSGVHVHHYGEIVAAAI